MTVSLSSTRFGKLAIACDRTIEILDGLFGFSERRFVLLYPTAGGPFSWLQSTENPDLAFVVAEPTLFLPGYGVRLTRSDYDRLALAPEGEMLLFSLVTIAPDPLKSTVNLQCPVVLNPERMVAKQLLLDEKNNSRHPLFMPGGVGSAPVARPVAVPITPRLHTCGTALTLSPP